MTAREENRMTLRAEDADDNIAVRRGGHMRLARGRIQRQQGSRLLLLTKS